MKWYAALFSDTKVANACDNSGTVDGAAVSLVCDYHCVTIIVNSYIQLHWVTSVLHSGICPVSNT